MHYLLLGLLIVVGALVGLFLLAAVLAVVVGVPVLVVITSLDVWASPKLLLVQLAARSITSHKVKSAIVGGLLSLGMMMLVIGTTFMENTWRQMETSITGGLVGHAQVYADDAKDTLAFFGGGGQSQDIGNILDFPKTKKALLSLPNVKAVIPMGRDIATVLGGNEFDERLSELRRLVEANDQTKIKPLVSRVRHMMGLLRTDISNRAKISRNQDEIKAQLAALDQALAPAFWAEFDQHPLAQLDFLDSKIAQLQADENGFFVPYVGTDLDLFAKNFDRFKIDTDNGSQMIPTGARGFLFNRQYYEEQAKNKVAHELDEIGRIMHDEQTTIADNVDLRERIQKNIGQYRRITYQLSDEDAHQLEGEMKPLLPNVNGGVDDLLKAFLDVNDSNFAQRYKFFYDHIAPKIRLYKVNVGDTLTLRAYTKSGYARAINLKVYGTFRFQGIDGSPVASRYNFVDLMSFRDLYGLMTPERQKELDAIKAEVGVKDVGHDNAEAELFGNDSTADAAERPTSAVANPTREQTVSARQAVKTETKLFTAEDLDNGVVLNAAIILKDLGKLRQTMADINDLSKKEGLHIQVIDWTAASGIVGQLIGVLMVILLFVIGIIFAAVLGIINNSMVMATMERVVEIGMMRAIGAQRTFVRGMYMLETGAIGLVAVVVGSVLASGLVMIAHHYGIRASADLLVIMFGGRYLYPTLSVISFAASLIIIAVVSLIATFYPALIATRIAPIVAMQRRE